MELIQRNILFGASILGAIIIVPYSWFTRQDIRFSSPVTHHLLRQDHNATVVLPKKFFKEGSTKNEILSKLSKEKYRINQNYHPSYKRTFCMEEDSVCNFWRRTRYGIANCNTFLTIKFDEENNLTSAKGYSTACYW